MCLLTNLVLYIIEPRIYILLCLVIPCEKVVNLGYNNKNMRSMYQILT